MSCSAAFDDQFEDFKLNGLKQYTMHTLIRPSFNSKNDEEY